MIASNKMSRQKNSIALQIQQPHLSTNKEMISTQEMLTGEFNDMGIDNISVESNDEVEEEVRQVEEGIVGSQVANTPMHVMITTETANTFKKKRQS